MMKAVYKLIITAILMVSVSEQTDEERFRQMFLTNDGFFHAAGQQRHNFGFFRDAFIQSSDVCNFFHTENIELSEVSLFLSYGVR